MTNFQIPGSWSRWAHPLRLGSPWSSSRWPSAIPGQCSVWSLQKSVTEVAGVSWLLHIRARATRSKSWTSNQWVQGLCEARISLGGVRGPCQAVAWQWAVQGGGNSPHRVPQQALQSRWGICWGTGSQDHIGSPVYIVMSNQPHQSVAVSHHMIFIIAWFLSKMLFYCNILFCTNYLILNWILCLIM